MSFKLYKREKSIFTDWSKPDIEGLIIETQEDGTCNVWDLWLPGTQEFIDEGYQLQIEVLAKNILPNRMGLYGEREEKEGVPIEDRSRVSLNDLFKNKRNRFTLLFATDTFDEIVTKLLSDYFEHFL